MSARTATTVRRTARGNQRPLAIVVAAALTAAALAATPAPARAAGPPIVVTMFSDHGDYIGQGTPREFDPLNASLGGTLDGSGIGLSVSGGTSGSNFTFTLAPPSGSSLAIGYYAGAQRTPFRSAGRPGIDIYGDGRGCNTDAGSFEVRDIAYTGTSISRLDLLYEQHCEGGVAALFGEIRVAEPDSSAPVVSSSSITWPAMDLGGVGTVTPVYVRNPGPSSIAVGSASITGPDAGTYSLQNDGCSQQTIPSGGACALYIGVGAPARGPHVATLGLPLGGSPRSIQLDSVVNAGQTELSMQSQPGDFVGAGLNYDYTAANASIGVSATPTEFHMGVSGNNGDSWSLDLAPASGTILAPGTYSNATRYPFQGTGNGLSVTGNGRGCNTVTGSFAVQQADFSPVDNSVQHFAATFEQHCEGATAALTGTIDYRAEAATVSPQVAGASASRQGSHATATWNNPASANYAYTVVRVQLAQPLSPVAFSGRSVYEGTGTSTQVGGLAPGVEYTATVFTVDTYGNISAPVLVRLLPLLDQASTQQYTLARSDGSTWVPIDSANLAGSLTVGSDSVAVVNANADLFTSRAGYNQDIGIFASDNGAAPQLLAWKESGGFAGVFSPNAAFVQTLFPMSAGHVYTFSLRWKSNVPQDSAAVIYAGAGSGAPYSATRLLAYVRPTDLTANSAISTSQYSLSGSNGYTWMTVDATRLQKVIMPAAASSASITANADMWTAVAGYNQDMAIVANTDGGPDQVLVWKESGGLSGTYSPNAASAQAVLPMSPGHTYAISLKWKTNKPQSPGAVVYMGAGAGPVFSPTSLTVDVQPAASIPFSLETTKQYTMDASAMGGWWPVDGNMLYGFSPSVDGVILLRGNADLFTGPTGYNQDLGICVNVDNTGPVQLVAWKESGGHGGIFSPNAAIVEATLPVTAGHLYGFLLCWRSLMAGDTGAHIYAGAGSATPYSLTSLVGQLIP